MSAHEIADGKGRILVADDDQALQDMVKRIAVSAGYQVVQALDGLAALEAVKTLPRPDLIILDIMMPRLDGRDVLKQLKADAATASIPVLVYSARGEHSDRIVGLELGAADYIEKPFAVDLLLRKIEYLIWKAREGK